MTEPILFPDAEGLTADELRLALDDHFADEVVVGTVVPNPRPERLVVVQRTGGPRRNLVTDAPTLVIEAWAPTEAEAHDISQIARALVVALAGAVIAGIAIYRVDELSGPQNLPDPLSATPRYSFTVALALRGAALASGS